MGSIITGERVATQRRAAGRRAGRATLRRQTMPNNERSRHITHGVARAPNRAMYYALGYQEADFDNPMIGVANGHSTITPCNSGLQRLADAAIDAVRAARAHPRPEEHTSELQSLMR